MMYFLLAVLLVPVFVFGTLALLEGKRANSLVRFFQHGDGLSRFNFFATLTASSAGLASTLLLIAVYGYFYGLGVFVWVVVFWWLTQWASNKTIKLVDRKRPGFWENRGTLHEFLGEEFGSQSVRMTAAVMTILCYTLLLVAEVFLSYRLVFAALKGSAETTVSFPIETTPLAIHVIILVAVFGYTAVAGFRAVVKTDAIQFCLIGVMILFVLGFLGAKLPDLATNHEAVFGSSLLQSVLNPVARDPLSFLFFFVLMNLLFWVAWWPVAMDQWHRCAASQSSAIATDRNFGTAGIGARVFVLLLAGALVLIGASTRAYVAPGGELPDPLPVFVTSLMPGGALSVENYFLAVGMAGLVLMGLMAAVMSTLDTYLVVVVQSFLVDIVIAKKTGLTLINVEKSDELQKRYLTMARFLTFAWLGIVGVLAYFVSKITMDAFNIVYAAFAFQMAFIGVLLVSLFGKPKGKGAAAVTSLSLGGIWCAISFPYLLIKLSKAVSIADLDQTYALLDMMFANTVLVAVVSAIAYFATAAVTGHLRE